MNHYFTIHLSKQWRIRISIEHRLDFAIELFSKFDRDGWSGIYLNLCSMCLFGTSRGLWLVSRSKTSK